MLDFPRIQQVIHFARDLTLDLPASSFVSQVIETGLGDS